MGNATASPIRRMTRPAAASPPLTPARALRLAMVRAAKDSVALPVSVLGIREEEGPLDELLGRLEDGLLILSLHQGEEPAGFVALDFEARSAAIEVQALGSISASSPEHRLPTTADAALARPLLSAFLREAEEAMEDTPLAGWLSAPRLGNRLPGAPEAALLLSDGPYRVVRLTLDLGAGGRQGLLVLMNRLPAPVRPVQPAAPETTVAGQALGASIPVMAILHRLTLSFSDVEALQEGQVLPLPGVTVSSVRLESGGLPLGPARLGQVAGMRAVRTELPLDPQLGDLPASGVAAPDLPLPTLSPPLTGPTSWSPSQDQEAPAWGPREVTPMD